MSQTFTSSQSNREGKTYNDGHLINMDSLLDSKLGDQNVKGGIKHTNDSSISNYGTITGGEVGNEDAEEKMGRLLLSKFGSILFDVANGSNLGDRFRVVDRFHLGRV